MHGKLWCLIEGTFNLKFYSAYIMFFKVYVYKHFIVDYCTVNIKLIKTFKIRASIKDALRY